MKVIALHETFDAKGHLLQQIPPDHLKKVERVYIHQFKLLEGIDDPAFQFLAIYNLMSNDRSYIQQFGRIMRVTKDFPEKTAYILDFPDGNLKEVWDRFIEYDKQTKSMFNPIAETFKKQQKLLNNVEYVDKHFRRRNELGTMDFEKDIQMPRSTNFVQVLPQFSLKNLKDAISQKLRKDDNIFEAKTYDYRTIVFYSVIVQNTPLLTDKYQFDNKSRVIVVRKHGGILSYTDTEGEYMSNESDLKLGKPINPSALTKVFSNLSKQNRRERSNLSRISFKNSFTGINTIRSRSISARSIAETTTYMDDSAQVMSNAYGSHQVVITSKDSQTGEIKREETNSTRYIGVFNGKLSEYGKYVLLDDYIKWVDEMAGIITSSATPSELFDRYAQVKQGVKKTQPKNILLDLEEIAEHIHLNATYFEEYAISVDGRELASFEDMSYKIKTKGDKHYFTLNSNLWDFIYDQQQKIEAAKKRAPDADEPEGKDVTLLAKEEFLRVYVAYDKEKSRYDLKAVDGENFEESLILDHPEYKSAIEFLNRRQSFRIIPEEKNTLYIGGEFYTTFTKFGPSLNVEQLHQANIMIRIKELKNPLMTEKGTPGVSHTGKKWELNTLFNFIDNGGPGTEFENMFGAPDIVVCDDMGSEMADFILCYHKGGQKKVVFVHAKGSSGFHPYSAKHIQEICSQAIKNIRFLNMFNEEDPTNRVKTWDKDWEWNGKIKKKPFSKKVATRIRKGPKTGKEVWEKIKATKRDPNCYKEVWLVLGNLLSASEFLKALKDPEPAYEAIQASILLQAVIQAVASVECKLRIFCSE